MPDKVPVAISKPDQPGWPETLKLSVSPSGSLAVGRVDGLDSAHREQRLAQRDRPVLDNATQHVDVAFG